MSDKCPKCSGKGTLQSNPPYIVSCAFCEGTGQIHEPILEYIHELEQMLAEVTPERDSLAEIVKRLPKTKDGVICADGATVLCPNGHPRTLFIDRRIYCCAKGCWNEGCQGDSGGGTHYHLNECTSLKAE